MGMFTPVENKQKNLERLKHAVEDVHQCSARHCMSVKIKEEVQGQTVWDGVVEVFDLTGNSKSSICYAWWRATEKEGSNEGFVAMLAIPPVISPLSAVRASIAAGQARGT
jgi:hypothetical protein